MNLDSSTKISPWEEGIYIAAASPEKCKPHLRPFVTMKLTTIKELLLALTAAAYVNAVPDTVNWGKNTLQCYNDGHEWGWQSEVLQHVNNACYGWGGNKGYYQDVNLHHHTHSSPPANWVIGLLYARESVTSFSEALRELRRSSYQLWDRELESKVGFTLKNEDCAKQLRGVTTQCGKGGESHSYGWWFR